MILPLHAAIRNRLRAVLVELYELEPAALPEIAVQSPPNRALGDLGTPLAFELARRLRKAPRSIAAETVAALGPVDGIARAEAAPNGYVNLFLDREAFARRVVHASGAAALEPAAAAAPDAKVIVEHTAINPNKAAHIGHLRNSALGDTLARTLRFLGAPVEVQNYIDDTGVQVADVVVGFQQLEHASVADVGARAAEPAFDYYCWDLYARVAEWYAADADRLTLRTRALHEIEGAGNATAEIGAIVAERIVRCHLATMSRLNVDYDLLCWEGDILRLEFWTRAFEVLKQAGAVHLQASGPQAGCWVMPLTDAGGADPEADGGDGEPEARAKIIVRSNGTVTYVGKDIAYQFWKFGVLDRDFHYRPRDAQPSGRPLWSTTSTPPAAGATASAGAPASARAAESGRPASPPPFGRAATVYNVIDTRQSYLQQLLKDALTAIDRPGAAERSVHVSYEMVALSHATARMLGYETDPGDQRPFVEVSGRKGLGVKADDLMDRVTAAARKEVAARHDDLDDAEADRIAAIIAVAAVRYFMIKFSRGKLIVFDIEEALSFEGESGPYLQYAAVRATNILRKLHARDGIDEAALAAALDTLPGTPLDDPDGGELWGLVLEASRLDEVADQAVRALELSVLAKYAFGLARAFHTFYHRCPVLAEERREVRLWRAAGVHYFLRQLTRALDLMGCEVPPRM
ncbi:MAG: arginine--tRNA ligase [Acidobacteria bacterium]|nr:arginine--tRNA ligase [Acidobacteriota bacterium]